MVSVVVIGRNEAPSLGDCLSAIRAALPDPSAQLIYVDSHSTDGSPAIAQAHGAKVFVPHAQATTPALGRYIGALEAQSDYLLFLDGDMILAPGFVQAALKVMDNGEYAGATGIREDVFLSGDEVIGRTENVFNCHIQRPAPCFGGALLLRRDALLSCGNWAPDVETNEEVELYARLKRHGLRVVELPVPMIRHMDRVREVRSPWAVMVNRRRLGLGQALVSAFGTGSTLQLLRLAWDDFFSYIMALLSLALLVGGKGWLALAIQSLEMAALLLARQPRRFVTHKLLFFYLPLGVLSFRRRTRQYHQLEDRNT